MKNIHKPREKVNVTLHCPNCGKTYDDPNMLTRIKKLRFNAHLKRCQETPEFVKQIMHLDSMTRSPSSETAPDSNRILALFTSKVK